MSRNIVSVKESLGTPLVLPLVMLSIGLVLTSGGSYLAYLSGSYYYLFAGLVLLFSGFLVWRGRVEGAWLYGGLVLATLFWSLWEVGLDAWAIASRLGLLVLLGFWIALPSTRRRLPFVGTHFKVFRRWISMRFWVLGGVVSFGVGLACFQLFGSAPADPAYQAGTTEYVHRIPASSLEQDNGSWPLWGGDAAGTRFSKTIQIDAENVQELEVAWTYRAGASPGGALTFQTTPITSGDSLYFCTGYNDVISLDSETGEERWRFRSNVDVENIPLLTCRGVAYYRTPDDSEECNERIITNTVDARLIAINAKTGELCRDFGTDGQTSLLSGMGEVDTGYYYVTSAPTIIDGKIVVGGWVMDGQYWGEPSGVIRAYDAVSGKFSWAFDMGRPDRREEPSEGESYTRATPNSWAPMSVDEDLNLIYLPTGNATPDYYGSQRRPFDDKYSTSVIAIDAGTGDVRWSFQTVRHDLWDYDVASQPTLVDIPTGKDGVILRALVQATKRGDVFVLDRETGEPIYEVVERPVPQAGAPATERLSPTQPFSTQMPSFSGPMLREADMWGLTPLDELWCRIKFREARYEGPFTPMGVSYMVMYPGYFGGANWGGVSVDTDRQIMVVNTNRMANYNRLLSRGQADEIGLKPFGQGGSVDVSGALPQTGTPYAADINTFWSPLEIPCQRPPYGLISAVDLTSGKLLWHQPLGTARDGGPLNIPSMLPLTMGVPNIGGSIVTRAGLTFIAAAQDRFLRAFRTETGELLWKARLPAAGHATPMTYIAADSGRQFVVIAAGGHPVLRTKMGDYIIAYALPE